MKHLAQLSPAETITVLQGPGTKISDLLKFTLMDLLLKKVLRIENVEYQSSLRDPVRQVKYISVGKGHSKYPVKTYENVFLGVFQKDLNARILFGNLIKIAYERIGSKHGYLSLFVTSMKLKEVFAKSFRNRIFGGFSYSEKGLIIKKEIEKEIAELEVTLPRIIASDKTKGLAILRSMGGNIFLLKGIDFVIAKEIDEEFFRAISKQNSENSSCGTAVCWVDFDHYSRTFDSSCSADSITEGGCSGDSGCGGDSGCSGCGGCGGD